MEKFSCNTGRLILLIRDIPKMIKQGRRGEWKPRNKGRGCGREGARGKGGKRVLSSKRVERGRISGKLLDNAYHSAIKKKQRKRDKPFSFVV